MFSVAIDGPAGAGKSTVAKKVAQNLNLIYVDTGALYRTVAVHLLNNNINSTQVDLVEKALADITVSMKHFEDGQHMFLCGEDVTSKIRTPEVSMMASTSSALPCVRKFLFELQTKMAEKYDVIMDGRDIGTVVLPNANVKVFLTASSDERAKRRVKDLEEKGISEDFAKVLKEIEQRDFQDMNRETAPLKQADDAILLDSSNLSFEQVVEKLEKIIKGAM